MNSLYIKTANYISDYKIEISFNDGTSGVVNLEPYLERGIFKDLKNQEIFKQFTLNSWTVEWQNGADFSPEFLNEILEKKTAAV